MGSVSWAATEESEAQGAMGPARVGSWVNVVEVEKGPLVSKCVVGNGGQGAERLSYEEGMPDLKAIIVRRFLLRQKRLNSTLVLLEKIICVLCVHIVIHSHQLESQSCLPSAFMLSLGSAGWERGAEMRSELQKSSYCLMCKLLGKKGGRRCEGRAGLFGVMAAQPVPTLS